MKKKLMDVELNDADKQGSKNINVIESEIVWAWHKQPLSIHEYYIIYIYRGCKSDRMPYSDVYVNAIYITLNLLALCQPYMHNKYLSRAFFHEKNTVCVWMCVWGTKYSKYGKLNFFHLLFDFEDLFESMQDALYVWHVWGCLRWSYWTFLSWL